MSEPNEHIAAGDPSAHAHGITPTDSHAATDSHATPANAFSDAQWAYLRAEDYSAGRAVVVLMLGIFSLGVFLYAAVAYSVWSRVGFLS
jgi:hypothetical protein